MKYGKGELVPVDEFVEKPVSPKELIRKLKNYYHFKRRRKMLVLEKNTQSEVIEELVKKIGKQPFFTVTDTSVNTKKT